MQDAACISSRPRSVSKMLVNTKENKTGNGQYRVQRETGTTPGKGPRRFAVEAQPTVELVWGANAGKSDFDGKVYTRVCLPPHYHHTLRLKNLVVC